MDQAEKRMNSDKLKFLTYQGISARWLETKWNGNTIGLTGFLGTRRYIQYGET